MNWTYKNKTVHDLPDDYIGFVYIITNMITGKQYIGKKLAKFQKTSYKTITLKNGNKRKRKFKTFIDSDWKTYYSSSNELKSDVASYGKEHFNREILMFCKTKNELAYYEAKYQFDCGVLLSDNWYNMWIAVKTRKMTT